MHYRIKYIFKGSRDKGQEIMDYYGSYKIYDIIQNEEDGDSVYEDIEPPEDRIVKTEYLGQLNSANSVMREKVKADKEHSDLPVFNQKMDDIDISLYKETKWIEREYFQNTYDIEKESFPLVGTALVEFLNFDIDCYINGGYSLMWKYEQKEEKDYVVGWNKSEGHNLNNLLVRNDVSCEMIFGSDDMDKMNDSIPFFIRMFGCKFINTEEWKYDFKEVEEIKQLQKRLKVFCAKVFFPQDNRDKRSHFERYCEAIKKIEKKKLRSYIPKDWFMPFSLEQALARECYAVMKGNVNLFICENCGLYSVASDNRSRLCDRLYYDGTINEDGIFKEYYYVCKKEKYGKNRKDKVESSIIEHVTQCEKKRLYNHISARGNEKLAEMKSKLVIGFSDIIIGSEGSYKEKVNRMTEDAMIKKTVNEYVDFIADAMNTLITESMGIYMKDKYLFTRKKNVEVKSLQGNLFE